MELQKYTKLIDDFINDSDAMTLLFNTYQSITEKSEQEKFILALIGQAVTAHKLLQYELKK